MRTAALVVLGYAFAGAAFAQTNPNNNPNVLVTATLVESGPMGYDEVTRISCRGIPTCAGTYTSTVRKENCTNYMTISGDIGFTGLNLGQSGPIQGGITVVHFDTIRLAGGVCTPGQQTQEILTYTGTWNLATQTGNITLRATDNNDVFPLTFKADITAPPPVFPMVVRAEIGPQTATVSADIQFRPQDVGRNGSVYVFASAPAARVRGALEAKAIQLGMAKSLTKADAPTPCVLAQMTPSGLVAVTTAQLSAFVTGAFSSAGAAVSILNNAPTPSVAGATFYVGYGSTGAAMIDNGIYRNAVLIPGDSVCPLLPYQTALWWNPGESGWGLNLNQQGSLMFGTLFTYDSSRAPLWLVMSAGALQSDGLSFKGDLYRTTGPAFNANPFTPIGAGNVALVGSMTVEFTEGNAGTLRYTMNGVEVVKSIQRQVYGSRAANCLPTADSRASSASYQDLWWNSAESGWGINVTHQDNTLFATLFTYDAGGRGLWLVMSAGQRQADGSYLGDLYRTTGSPFNSIPFVPLAGSDVTLVGTMRLRFTDGNNGTLTYSYNGANVTKSITRQVFSAPVSACN